MKVKRFVADSFQEALQQVKKEMGKEAIILHSRKFKEGGFLGFFAREKVEVTAAVDYAALNAAASSAATTISPAIPIAAVSSGMLSSATNIAGNWKEGELLKEPRLGGNYSVVFPPPADSSLYIYPPAVRTLYNQLLGQEVEEKIACQLLEKLMGSLPPQAWDNTQLVKKALQEEMARMLIGPKPITLEGQNLPQVAVLVGPTGVGKTTTIAKLAANFFLMQKRKVALVTIDTYRIAAVEQLKTYAQIIGVPLEVVFTPRALRESLQRHMDKDIILIDTAGRSPKNDQQMEELGRFLSVLTDGDIYLVMSATTSERDMWDVYRRFQRLGFKKIIFTKLDETEALGPIFNLSCRARVPLSYITTGQNVPDDIEIASPHWLVNMILGGGGAGC